MKAAYIKSHGPIDSLEVGDLPVPKLSDNDVLIKTSYGALNHLDLFIIEGWSGLKLQFPHILGADGSGIVAEVGKNVSELREGDRVTTNPTISCGKCKYCLAGNQVFCKDFSIKGEFQWGTFSEFFTTPEVNALPVPNDFPLDKAAAAPLTFLTAYRMIKTQANVKPGDVVFVHGAGGGVSSAAIQIAKYFGAVVIATTSTSEKIERTKALGADYVINYKENTNYTKTVYFDLTNKEGVDVVIDNVGQNTFASSIRMLKPGGIVVTCGSTSGSAVDMQMSNIFWKHLEIKGSTMGNQSEFREVMKLVFKKKIHPIIDNKFQLENVVEAEKYLSQSKQFGKVLIRIS